MNDQLKNASATHPKRHRQRRLIGLGAVAIALALLVRGATSLPAREWLLRRTPLPDLQRRARMRPNDWLLQYWLGRKCAAAEDLHGAIAAYMQATNGRPEYLPAWVGLGEVLRRSGRYSEALGVLSMVLAREPRSADAHASLALIDEQRGAVPRALEEAQRAVTIDPHCAAGWYALGVIHHRLQQPGRVLPALRSAVRFAPEEARYHQLLGEALRDMGQLDAVEPPLLKAAALAPSYSETHLSLGQLYAARPPASANLPRAVRELERARDLAPRDWGPHYQLGRAYLRQGRYTDAATEFQDVLALSPDYDPALLDLSRAYAGMGRRSQAKQLLAEFEMASQNYQRIESTRLQLAHDPDNAALHFELAHLYLDRGRNRAAYGELQTGLERDPKNRWAQATVHRLLQTAVSPVGHATK